MSYQVYFGDLTEENQALILTLLRLKDEAGTLEPEEAALLVQRRGTVEPMPYLAPEAPAPMRRGGRPTTRRSAPRRNGRAQQQQFPEP